MNEATQPVPMLVDAALGAGGAALAHGAGQALPKLTGAAHLAHKAAQAAAKHPTLSGSALAKQTAGAAAVAAAKEVGTETAGHLVGHGIAEVGGQVLKPDKK